MLLPNSALAVAAEILFVAILILGALAEGHRLAAILAGVVLITIVLIARYRSRKAP